MDAQRRYIDVNDAACKLLGYTRQEFLTLTIDDISFPSAAHVAPMHQQFLRNGAMSGIFALRRKSGEAILIKFESGQIEGRSIATWTHYQPVEQLPDEARFTPASAKQD